MGPTLNRLADAAARAWWATACCHASSRCPFAAVHRRRAGLWLHVLFLGSAIDAVRATLEQWSVVEASLAFLDRMGLPATRSVLAPLVLMAMLVPAVVGHCAAGGGPGS